MGVGKPGNSTSDISIASKKEFCRDVKSLRMSLTVELCLNLYIRAGLCVNILYAEVKRRKVVSYVQIKIGSLGSLASLTSLASLKSLASLTRLT